MRFDTPEQVDARESSLVCRENGKLRKRIAELEQAQADTLNSFRATLAERPTVADLEAARKQADDVKGSGLEAIQELEAVRERVRQLEAEREAEREVAEKAREDACQRERDLNAELEALAPKMAKAEERWLELAERA